MLSKQVENTVGKAETACYEQFLLFPQCFQKACFQGASKGVIMWEWVNKDLNGFKKLFVFQSLCWTGKLRGQKNFGRKKSSTYRELQFFRIPLKQIFLYEIKKGQSWDLRINSTYPEI